MAVVTLLAEAVRGTITSPNFTIPAGAPAHVRIAMVSSVFPTTLGFTWDLTILKSPDGVQPFVFDQGSGGAQSGLAGTPTGKGGSIYNGLPTFTYQTDGAGSVIKAVATVSPGAFSWGLTAEALP